EPAMEGDEACTTLDGGCIPLLKDCYGPGPGCALHCDAGFDVASAPTASLAGWGSPTAIGDHVLSAPVVAQLDDDDCDGVVGWRDVPDVVFRTASSPGEPEHGRLVIASMVGGSLVEKLTTGPDVPANDPTTQPAAVRVGDTSLVLVCTEDDRLRA